MSTSSELINESILTNSIVHVAADDLCNPEMDDGVGSLADLIESADDWAESRSAHGSIIMEYWGTTEAGDEWRVHVHH